MATYEFETVTVAGAEREFMEIETVNTDERVGLFKDFLSAWDEQKIKQIFREANSNANRDTALKGYTMDSGVSAYDYYKGMFSNLTSMEEAYNENDQVEIDSLRAQVEQLQTDLAAKADQTTVDAIDGRVTALENA